MELSSSSDKAYLSCRRQLCRLLRGSLLTEVEGFSNSSSNEAGTGQSGILTGVPGFEGFPSLFSSMRCHSNIIITLSVLVAQLNHSYVGITATGSQAVFYLPQTSLLQVLFELLVLQQNRLHAVPQLTNFGLQHELVLSGAAQLLLHQLQLHLYVLTQRVLVLLFNCTTENGEEQRSFFLCASKQMFTSTNVIQQHC